MKTQILMKTTRIQSQRRPCERKLDEICEKGQKLWEARKRRKLENSAKKKHPRGKNVKERNTKKQNTKDNLTKLQEKTKILKIVRTKSQP
eukprot:TRINITY_DN908_c0_g1_i3.p1 TRINITY_DN908_c0_g1~~TRINITY_DN908_c0_g1_i3.p1  ORF type:complete len:90 (-),score=13.38 TRINITY_DN908_c0_g1_i3:844-1113(-)